LEQPCLLASLLQVIQANSGHLWVSQRASRGSPDALPWRCEGVSKKQKNPCWLSCLVSPICQTLFSHAKKKPTFAIAKKWWKETANDHCQNYTSKILQGFPWLLVWLDAAVMSAGRTIAAFLRFW